MDFSLIMGNIHEIVVRNIRCQFSTNFEFLTVNSSSIIWCTCTPEPEKLNPQAMCYRSTTLFPLDNIGALNERRKRDVHSIKSANISSSRGFCMSVVGFPQSQDSPKIICAIDKWYNRIIKCLSTRSNFIVRVTRLRSINIFMTYSVPLFIYGCLIIIREVRFEREGHISIIVIGILTSNILRLSFLTL